MLKSLTEALEIYLVAEWFVFHWREIVKFFWEINFNYASISNEINIKLVIAENSKVSPQGKPLV